MIWTIASATAAMPMYFAMFTLRSASHLTYIEVAVDEAICIWCVGSALIVTAIWLLSLPDVRQRQED